jgi:hypothetical protein
MPQGNNNTVHPEGTTDEQKATDKIMDNQKGLGTPQSTPGEKAGPRLTTAMGFGLLTLAFLFAYLFLVFWPTGLSPETKGETITLINLFRDRLTFYVPFDVRLLLMVMAAGGLGSFIHAATSFDDYVGNERLTTNWIWWYVLRPFIGMILAVIFYLVIRGGFLSAGTEAGNINPFGIAALAGLVGMFSKQAADKLNEVFNTLFRTAPGEGDSKRKDDLTNPVPSISDVEPKSVEAETQNVVVTLKGTGFVEGSVVRINGINRETEFVSPTQLTAKLLPEDVTKEGELEVIVFNPHPGGGNSTPIKIKIAPKSTDG